MKAVCPVCKGERGSYDPCGDNYAMVWLACQECDGSGEVKPPCAECRTCAALGEIYVEATDSWDQCPDCDRVDPTLTHA